MKHDLPAAAQRLMSSCSVHTYEREQPARSSENRGKRAKNRGRGITLIYGKGGSARPVEVEGRTYASAAQAAVALHKSTRTIYAWLRTGEAKYL